MSLEEMKRENSNSGAIIEEIDSPITVKHLDLTISAAKKKSAPGQNQ